MWEAPSGATSGGGRNRECILKKIPEIYRKRKRRVEREFEANVQHRIKRTLYFM